jgi:hypothetical protein
MTSQKCKSKKYNETISGGERSVRHEPGEMGKK